MTIIMSKASKGFVETPFVTNIIARAMTYISAGFPIHFRGAAGTGKTTLAMKVAELLGRPLLMIHGDEELTGSRLIGSESGYRVRSVRDNFIGSVLKIEEKGTKSWVDSSVTIAIKNGYTLIYDEFTRSRAEANNVLLPVLQEGVLNLPANGASGAEAIIKVRPEFRAIFTSNPEEYAGVHRAQDALRDRMVTLDLDTFDRETEILITSNRSGLNHKEAATIVDIVRAARDSGEYEFAPTVRAPIIIARAVKESGPKINLSSADPLFVELCLDVLAERSRIGSKAPPDKIKKLVCSAIESYCGNDASPAQIISGGNHDSEETRNWGTLFEEPCKSFAAKCRNTRNSSRS